MSLLKCTFMYIKFCSENFHILLLYRDHTIRVFAFGDIELLTKLYGLSGSSGLKLVFVVSLFPSGQGPAFSPQSHFWR